MCVCVVVKTFAIHGARLCHSTPVGGLVGEYNVCPQHVKPVKPNKMKQNETREQTTSTCIHYMRGNKTRKVIKIKCFDRHDQNKGHTEG